MDEKKKNLCAMIPESLHIKVREEQEQLALTLSEYVEKIIREHFEGGKTMANGTRTLISLRTSIRTTMSRRTISTPRSSCRRFCSA